MKKRAKLLKVSFRPLLAISGFLAIALFLTTIYTAGIGNKQMVSADTLKAGNTFTEVRSTPAAAASTQTCVPMGGTQIPPPLDLSDTPEGLKQVIDQPTLYQIFGNRSDDLRSQVRQCAPKEVGQIDAEFTAETNYQLTWRYNYVEIGNGRCKVQDAAVGIHIKQVMPQWTPTKDAQPKLVSQWNDFIKALNTHEQGHLTLDLQYAQMLLDDLKNFPPTPCGQMPESVRHLTDTDTNLLIQANDNYDETTNHGATQGAILP